MYIFSKWMADGSFKNLPRTASCDKVLHNKAFNIITNNPK